MSAAESRRAPRGRDFPVLGTVTEPSTVTRAAYFVTGPNARAATTAGRSVDPTSGPFHAKAMGTAVTACGLPAASWVKLWDVPFARAPQPTCRQCFDLVAQCG